MRIARKKVNMEIAHVMAQRSTCLRKQVGCVITIDGRIVVTGYNGVASDECHCTELFRECPDGPGCQRVVHAEAGAISFAARKGIALEGGTLYVTLSPCKDCAKLIINAGIEEVFYSEEYRDTTGLEILRKSVRVKVSQIKSD